LYLSLVFFIVSGLLWFYSTTYKREFLLGNFIVALLTALVPFLVLLFELPLLARSYGSDVTPLTRYLIIWFMGFSLFAFLLNLIREIIKDAIDFEGDMAFGKKTIPVVWGINSARWISVILSLATIGLLVSAWILFIRDYITLVYFTVMVIFPLCVVIYMLCRAGYRNMFKKISLLLKITMVGGLGYMIVANLIINHLK
jgi:4-hydroxybenzoate polyprenyltransferase